MKPVRFTLGVVSAFENVLFNNLIPFFLQAILMIKKHDAEQVERTEDATPHASSLVESLRDIGYSLDTALADIIDNSITAGAKSIRLLAETLSDEPAIGILDDGEGMTEEALIEAMRPGSQNPREERDSADLGRFGLGLKSASFSQCRKLTVVTCREGNVSAASWDLDRVAVSNQWRITMHSNLSAIPWSDRLKGKPRFFPCVTARQRSVKPCPVWDEFGVA